MNHHVAILGGTTFDHIVYLDELPKPVPKTYHHTGFNEGIGSTGAGKALPLTKLGVANTLYSLIGPDDYGTGIKTFLAKENVNSILANDPKGTERHINIMDRDGQRISMFVTQSSENFEHDEPVIKKLLQQSTLVVLNIIGYCRQLIPLVKQSGKPVWTDLHDYDGTSSYHDDFIDASQYIHLSSDNLPHYRQVMERLAKQGKELVICTHGKLGASLITKEEVWLEQPALENIPVVDSNGAGDSFFAGFLYAYLHNKPLQDCLKYGVVCGGYAIKSNTLCYQQLSPQFIENKIIEHRL